MKVIPMHVYEVSQGGYVVSIAYQKVVKDEKGKKHTEDTHFSKYARDGLELGTVVTEVVALWYIRNEE